MNWFKTAIWHPIKSHVAISMMVLGIVLIAIGVTITSQNFEWLSKIFLHSGSAVLGGGVFAVILKSAQFTDIFQKHIATVFYDPASVDKHTAIERWKVMTDSILKDVIPENYAVASKILEQHFLNADLHYHFEEFDSTLDIVVDESGKIATIMNVVKAKLIISPCVELPVLNQDYLVDSGGIDSMELFLNSQKQDLNTCIDQTRSTSNHQYISVDLTSFTPPECNKSERVVEFERIIKFTQDLTEEPYIYINIQRFTKGAAVKTKITPGFSVNLVKTGLDNWQEDTETADTDVNGYLRWKLANKEFLLLPGQGYILIVNQNKEA